MAKLFCQSGNICIGVSLCTKACWIPLLDEGMKVIEERHTIADLLK